MNSRMRYDIFMRKRILTSLMTSLLACCLPVLPCYAQYDDGNLGQTIQIYTHFRSIIGKPVWLLIIRDLDHGQVLPYLYEFKSGDNFWLALTHSRNYQITVSSLRFDPRRSKINNFCQLQSGVIRGKSLYITMDGDLRADTSRFNCNVSRYADANFSIAPSNTDQTDQ